MSIDEKTEAMSGVAIIGMTCRVPGAASTEEFYEKIWAGTELIKHFSEEELLASGYPPEILSDPAYVRASSALDNVEDFAAEFFNYSAREAQSLDPQQRLFLECAWDVVERAGYSTDSIDVPVGVFAGASANTYILDGLLKGQVDLDLDFMNYVETRLGSDKDFLATRVSHKLNLTGPSFTIQSACSTSLVAVHTACQSLLAGECDMALAGAVTVLYPLTHGYRHKPDSMVSPDGHCRTFSASAKGTVFGSGAGVVMLKRLEDATTDRDNILAVIKGSAINNDGALKPSYTSPSLDLQAEVVADAMVLADTAADSISYVEAHGTGTPIGDPVEVAALTQAYREFTDKKQYCAIGSVKTNIGHLDVAAGMASLIKTTLVLQHKTIPPSLHFDEPNPAIDFENSPFYVNAQLRSLPKGETPCRAGITSLGVGGTNVHMILEEAPLNQIQYVEQLGDNVINQAQLIVVSAKTSSALSQACINLAEQLNDPPSSELADVAYTLQVGRNAFAWRGVFVCKNVEHAIQQLETASLPEAPSYETTTVRLILSAMHVDDVTDVLGLYLSETEFRTAFDLCVNTWNEVCIAVGKEAACWQTSEGCTPTLNVALDRTLRETLCEFCVTYALGRVYWRSM